MNSIKSLFNPASPKVNPQDAIVQAQQANPHSKKDGETYHQYGSRMCGLVNGAIETLVPFLNKVYTQERKRQEDEVKEQIKIRQQREQEITSIETQIETQKQNLGALQAKIQGKQKEIEENKGQIDKLKSDPGTENSGLKVQMILGLIIVCLLTVYLFVFYSSTIYMGFVMPSDSDDAFLSTAMFNPRALPNAWKDGITGFCFVLLMPVIFLALGFLLHFFTSKPGIAGKMKAAAVVVLTLVFDCILAYKIGETLYDAKIMTLLGSFPPYSISIAIKDINTWAVIFCGFIAYIIWGMVFDQVVTAYEERTSHKNEIKGLNRKIDDNEKELQKLANKENEQKNTITYLEGQLKQKKQMLDTKVIFSITAIKQELNNFFIGWIVVMKNLQPNDLQKASDIYKDTVTELFK